MESWTEIRCVACVPLGWDTSRLLLRIRGFVPVSDAIVQLKCGRCKSVIEWTLGTPILRAVEYGRQNHRRQKGAFE